MINFILNETLAKQHKSLTELAQETGIAISDLEMIFFNRTTTIELAQLARLANTLNCPITSIIDYRPEEKRFTFSKLNFSTNGVQLDFAFQLDFKSNFQGSISETYTGKLTQQEVRVKHHLTKSLLFNLSPTTENKENIISRMLNEAEKIFVMGSLINELIEQNILIIEDLAASVQVTWNDFLSVYPYTTVYTPNETSIIVETDPTSVPNLKKQG